ncbi:hypothetical protein AYX19_20955 (plasmid) [Paenarthrobacter ureafaciens]|nr:hypothetical protein AYX19_20955 [Paenarthrobacter ureafaciens]
MRPPLSIPAADSPKQMAVEVPAREAPMAAMASADRASVGFSIAPWSSTRPARWHRAFMAARELNRSMNTRDSMAGRAMPRCDHR